MKHFNVFKFIVNCASCIVNRISASSIFSQNSLRIGQKTPPYPLRALSVPVKLFFLLLALGLSVNVWGDEGDFYDVYMTANVAGTGSDGKNNFAENLGKSGFIEKQFGSLTSDFVITGVYLKCYDDWGANYKSSGGQMIYKINDGGLLYWNNFSDHTAKDGNNYEYQKTGELLIGDVDGPSGNYTAEFWFQTWGWGDRYLNNGGDNYKFTYTILPPDVKASNLKVTTPSDVISGSGTSTSPWLVLVGNTLTLTGSTSTLDWEDANSSVYLSTSQNSGYAATLEYSAQQPDATIQSVTVYGKCYNSTDNLYSSTSRSKTIYYQFVQPRTVNFNAGTGSCDDESLTEANYGAGVTLPEATPQTNCDTAGWTFAGWAKEEITEETSVAPTLYAARSTYTDITDGETLYAVYKLMPEQAAYELVTSAPSNWAGKYLLSAGSTIFMNGSLQAGTSSGQANAENTTVDLSSHISNNSIPASVGDNYYVIIEAVTDGYIIATHSSETPYFYATNSSNLSSTANKNTATTNKLSINLETSGFVTITGYSKNLKFYNSKYFRFYSGDSNVSLYRYSAGDVTYNSNPVAAVQYDLTFNMNGATAGTQPAVAKHKQNDVITNFPSVTDFVKTGFRCIGWNTTSDATTALTSYTMPSQAATLYAVWIPTYAITWVVEGVTTHTDLPIEGEAINKPTNPASINNRVFVGWSATQITGHANTFTNFTSHTCTGATETWYAVFATPEYTEVNAITSYETYIITSFDKDGKIVYLPNDPFTSGNCPNLNYNIDVNENKISTVVTPDMLWTIVSTGDGAWSVFHMDGANTYYLETTSSANKVRVITDKSPKTWTITYADGAFSMVYNYDQEKLHHLGTKGDTWYNSTSTQNFDNLSIKLYTPANSYRNYTTAPNTATFALRYDLAGGEGTAINQYELLTGASVTLATAPSRFGYSFAGWDDGSQTYAAGASYTIASTDVTLTAQWTILVPTSFTLASSNGYDLGTETNNTTQMSVDSWEPANLLDSQKGVTWSIKSGDEGYLTVDENGLVTVIGCSANATVVATSIADPNITAEFTIHIYAPFCSGYSFRYGTEGQGDWNNCDPVCFTETDKDDGYTGKLFISDLFTIPNKPKFEVWWQNHRDGWSEFADMTALPLHHLHNQHSLSTLTDGKGIGATGYLVIYGGYNTHNKFIDFMPDGYVLRLGSGETWTSVPFHANEDIWSTTWETDIVELTNDITSGNFYVGVKTAEDYVWLEGISNERNMTAMGKKSGKGESDWGSNISSSDNGAHGKFRIYANSNNENGNWFCHFVPYYQIAFNTGEGGSAVAPGYVSIEADNKSYTVTMSPETNPTRVGYKFAGWSDGTEPQPHTTTWTIMNISQDITLTAVWNKVNTLTFHYDGFTTDCDDVWSVATGEQVTLPDGKEVAGKTFDGWSDGKGNTYDAGYVYTLNESTTLTATYTKWTLTYNYNSTIVSGVEVPETGVVIPTEAQGDAVDNNIFIGFTKTQNYSATDLPNDFIPAGSVYTPTADGEILYALYRQGDSTYQLIKDTKDLRLGAHVVLASLDDDYAMGNTFISGQDTLPAIVVTKDGDEETISFGKDVQEWILTTSSQAGSNAEYQGTWAFNRSDNKKLASSNKVGKVTLGTNVTTGSSFRIAIDASGRATVQCVATTYNINTISLGEEGSFGCYNPNTIDAPDLAIYQHIGTKYVTSPTAVYRLKSADMVNGRLDKNDYYAAEDSVTLSGYANEGYSTSNRVIVLDETTRDTISKVLKFKMPANNVIDTLTNRALLDTLKFVVPGCVTPTPSKIRANSNTEVNLPNEVANVNSWNFVGWTKTAINDTSEVHSEIFTTTYTTPRLKKDTAETFYAIYSYDGLPTTGFVLSTFNGETTYYLGEYVSGSDNRYFRAVTDKAQALVLHNNEGKLSYQSGDTVAYLKANNQSSTYNLLTTNEAGATVWIIDENEETGTTSIKTNIGGNDRYLRFNYNSGNNPRYSIYTDRQNPVKEKAPSYTTNPVCDEYIHYFVSDEEDADPEYSYKLGNDGKAVKYYPRNDCENKRFMGWSETKVSALQQEAPSTVNFATQTYDHTQNLYAVYAAENGGKVSEYGQYITESVSEMSYFKTSQDSGMSTLKTRYTFHNAKYYGGNIRLTKGKNADSSFVTTSLIRNLEKIQVVYNTNSGRLQPKVFISTDSVNWTSVDLNKSGENYYATPSASGDYYITLCITTSSADSYSYSDISSLIYTLNKKYWFSDYSTNCTVAETATISFKNSDDSQAKDPIEATSIGDVITLPTPKTDGQHFDGWTIGDVQYAGGDEYKLSHDTVAVASWSEAQLVCDVETLYVASAKGITNRSSMVAHISCPDITEGTLTIPDTINGVKSKMHFVIEGSEATAEGLNAIVAVEFTPATNNNMTPKITAKIGDLSVQFTVKGTTLPENFVIAHQGTDSKWYALPADITAFGTYKGYEITVNNNEATAPQNAVYHLGAGQDATSIRLMADTLALMTSATASAKTKIKVGNDTLNTLSYWKMVTDNNNTIAFVNTAANNSLKVNSNNKFGMYVTGTSNDSLLHIFKVTNTIATIPIETMNWTENSFSFIPSVDIPANNEFRLRVNDEEVETESCTARNALYDVTTSSTTFGAQKLVQLQWYNNSTLVATASAVTPLRLTSDATLAGIIGCDTLDAKSLDIVVTSGTLTVNAKATIHNLDIYPGATVAITNDTLTATTLSFHGGLTSTESNYDYNVPRLYIQKESCTTAPGYLKKNAHIYYYLNVNADNYYPFTVPFKTTGANIRYASRPNTEIQSIWGNAIVISEYNGKDRGEGKTTTTKYWKDLSYSNDLIPGVGYIITAKKLKGEPYAALRIMMMASDIDATTDTVAVGAWGVNDDKIAWYNKGWNYIANPYTAMLSGSADEEQHAIQSGTEVRYATIPSPTVDGYDQVPIEYADLKPFYGFFIQAGETGNYNFVKNKLHSAPAYLLAEEKPEQEAYINLDGAAMHDRFGLIVGPRHSDDYEFNADLSKELGTANDLRAWLMSGDMKMAYLAVDDETAATLIPLNLRTPSKGDYTFSLRESSRVADLEGLFLTDYQEGIVTNLLYNDYTFSAPAGAVEKRFALNAVRSAKAPTELGGETERKTGGGAPPHKRLKDGHIYIFVNGAIYNAEGKEVRK